MTTVAPNRSLARVRVERVSGERCEVRVLTSRAAWPRVADLLASRVGTVVPMRGLAGSGLAPGDELEVECSLGPAPEGLALEFTATVVSAPK